MLSKTRNSKRHNFSTVLVCIETWMQVFIKIPFTATCCQKLFFLLLEKSIIFTKAPSKSPSTRFCSVVVSTWDSESQDPGSNPGRTFFFEYLPRSIIKWTNNFFLFILVKYEQHAGQSQKKRLLAMAQNECLLNNSGPPPPQSSSSSGNQLKQEPTEFATSSSLNYDYPPNFEHQKRSSWVGPPSTSAVAPPPSAHHNSHHHHSSSSNKRDSGYSSTQGPSVSQGQGSSQGSSQQQQQQQPPLAHIKNAPSSSSSWNGGTPIYHHLHHSQTQQNIVHHHRQQPQNTTPLGNSPIGATITGTMIQPQQAEIYAAQNDLYRRPTVFVSQAPYQAYNRVVPPPAHNGSSRQVNIIHAYSKRNLIECF